MENIGLNELRELFLSFFESKGHYRLKSYPLIPQNDNSLLLINAGMAPLKPFFTGEQTPPAPRATSCQKCIRTPDIESVGKDDRHGTYFEMLGNFSFGDYFKSDACRWAWEFVTQVLKMPADRLYPSVFLEDDEAYDIWTREVGVDPSHVVRLGRRTTSGRLARVPAARALRFILTAARNTAAAARAALPAATATGTSSSGIWSLLSSIPTARATTPRLRKRTSTPVSALNAWPASCKTPARFLTSRRPSEKFRDHVSALTGVALWAGPQKRCVHSHHHRPRPLGYHDGVRRRHAVQCGPWLCAAPSFAPRRVMAGFWGSPTFPARAVRDCHR